MLTITSEYLASSQFYEKQTQILFGPAPEWGAVFFRNPNPDLDESSYQVRRASYGHLENGEQFNEMNVVHARKSYIKYRGRVVEEIEPQYTWNSCKHVKIEGNIISKDTRGRQYMEDLARSKFVWPVLAGGREAPLFILGDNSTLFYVNKDWKYESSGNTWYDWTFYVQTRRIGYVLLKTEIRGQILRYRAGNYMSSINHLTRVYRLNEDGYMSLVATYTLNSLPVNIFKAATIETYEEYSSKELDNAESQVRQRIPSYINSPWTGKPSPGYLIGWYFPPEPEKVTEYYRALCNKVYSSEYYPLYFHQESLKRDCDDGHLVSKCVADVENQKVFNGNAIAYANDCKEMKSLYVSTLNNMMNALYSAVNKKADWLRQTLANLYLSFHYGWKLFINDTEDLLGSAAKDNNRFLHTHAGGSFQTDTDWDVKRGYTIVYDPYSDMARNHFAAMRYKDAFPTLKNLWDMTPYSFVVDWFTPMGDILTTLTDFNDLTHYCTIHCCISTIKAVKQLELPEGCDGNVRLTYFLRMCGDTPASPHFETKPQNPNFTHFVEGGSLCVTRLG